MRVLKRRQCLAAFAAEGDPLRAARAAAARPLPVGRRSCCSLSLPAACSSPTRPPVSCRASREGGRQALWRGRQAGGSLRLPASSKGRRPMRGTPAGARLQRPPVCLNVDHAGGRLHGVIAALGRGARPVGVCGADRCAAGISLRGVVLLGCRGGRWGRTGAAACLLLQGAAIQGVGGRRGRARSVRQRVLRVDCVGHHPNGPLDCIEAA
jgi:hypothetical protein